MPSITRDELKEKYPMMFRVFKIAEDFRDAPECILKPEYEFMVRVTEESAISDKEIALRMAIYAGVMESIVEMVEPTIEFYKKAIKQYEKEPKR